MMFKTLAGREVSIDIRPSKWPRRSKDECKSNLQWTVGQSLESMFYGELILEEFSIPREKLYLDFYMPRRKLAVEVMGEQHSKFSLFFHNDADGFKASKARDKRKSDWCHVNGIKLLVIEYDCKEIEMELKRQYGT